MDSDLSALATQEARSLARVLNDLLRAVHFDVVNRELRLPQHGGDYDVRPFPLPGSPQDIAAMKVRLRQGVKTSPNADERRTARRIQYAFMFFMFGEALPREPLDELFGDRKGSIDEGLDLGLFLRVAGQAIRMNGLSLFSRRLRHVGDVIHLFADTPPHFERRMAATPRVYIGADSYALMDRVSTLVPRAECCVEMGSGSGVQLIAALKSYPCLARAIGKECDRRALNVSAFNAALNGVANRMIVVAPEADLQTHVDGHAVSFVMTNPPFLAVPRQLDVGRGDPPLDLRTIFPRAGWGGKDGLDVTRQFVDEVQSLLVAGAPCIIYSQFAGDDRGPIHARRYAERAGFDFTFEPLPSRCIFTRHPDTHCVLEGRTQPVLPAARAAESVARLLVAALVANRYPQRFQTRVKEGSPDHELLLRLATSIEESYRGQAITHFHDGFAILTRSEARL